MNLKVTIRALVIWGAILLIAITNGVLRELVLSPMLGESLGLFSSGVLLSALILVVAYVAIPWIGRASVRHYILIGIGWLCLTLVFEFSLGIMIQGKSWVQLSDAYRFSAGNIWPIVLLVTAIAPYLTAKVRGLV